MTGTLALKALACRIPVIEMEDRAQLAAMVPGIEDFDEDRAGDPRIKFSTT